jgi:hypothetical protein
MALAIGGSALLGASAAKSAASTQAAAADRAAQLQNEQFQQTREDLAPYRAAGQTALNALTPLATNYQKFGMGQFQQDPGYAFRLSEGQKALDRQAAARGGLISGSALKAAQRYGQEMGSQEYMNAFNRYQLEREARLNPLQSLTGMGRTTANTLGTEGQSMASNVGNAYINQGVNQGNALLAGSQARSSAYGNLAEAAGKFYENYRGGPKTSGRWNPDTGTFG